jgi:two-component system, OmpR family, alkaline phosphatase synthesis response regulator PhoP
LSKSGYDVISAEDGDTALEMAKSEVPDLILLDLRLPGKDGFEVCSELKSDDKYKGIPIILLTASSGLQEEKLKTCKHDSFVLKPYQFEDLLEKIRSFIPEQ